MAATHVLMHVLVHVLLSALFPACRAHGARPRRTQASLVLPTGRQSYVLASIAVALIVLLTAMVSLAGVTNSAQASPNGALLPAPKEGPKVILSETSIDGPAIMATYHPDTVLAWTGTDRLHHLNIMTSSDGLRYSNKHILPELSLWRPAVAFIDSARGAPNGTIVLAWTGTDANHSLNVEFIKIPDFTVTRKVTFWGETSFTAPALTTINGDVNSDIYLSWAGTDPAHTLNVLHMATMPQTSDKHILWGWSSISRPNLSTDFSSGGDRPLILAWTGTNNHIYCATTSDKVHWTMASASPLAQQSAWAPSMIGLYAPGLPNYWLAWTGSGSTSTRSLHVQYTQHYPAWSDANSSATLPETAISSPALAYNGGGDTGEVLITWTGADYEHHLNVAIVTLASH